MFHRNKFKELRKQQRMSARYIADQMGMSRDTIVSWELGRRNPKELQIRKLAEILKIDSSEISDIKDSIDNSNVELLPVFSDAFIDMAKNNSESLKNKFSSLLNNFDQISRSINSELVNSSLAVKALIDSLNSMFYVKDKFSNFVTANKAFYDYCGLDYGIRIQTKNEMALLPREEAMQNIKEDKELMYSGKYIRNKRRVLFGSRKRKIALVTKTPILDNDKKPAGIVAMFTDITEIEETKVHFNALSEAVNQHGSEALYLQSPKTNKYIFLNNAVANITGYSLEEFHSGKIDFFDLVYEEDRDRVLRWKDMDQSSTEFFRIKTGKDEIRWISCNYSLFKINDSNTFVIVTFRDTTDKIKLKDGIIRLHTAINSSNESMWIGTYIKNKFKFSYISQNIHKILGFGLAGLFEKPKSILSKVFYYDRSSFFKWLKKDEFPKDIEFRIVNSDCTISWFYCKITQNKDYFYGIIYNISSRKRLGLKRFLLQQAIEHVEEVVWIRNMLTGETIIEGRDEELYGVSIKHIKDPYDYWLNNILHNSQRDEHDDKYRITLEHRKNKRLDTFTRWQYKAVHQKTGEVIDIDCILGVISHEGVVYEIGLDRRVT